MANKQKGKPAYQVTNKGAQAVNAPIPQSAGKKGVVTTGKGDLRNGKK